MSQIERIGVMGNAMFFGVYPSGRFYEYDLSKEWGKDNPRKYSQIPGQSRPVAMLGMPEIGKVYSGTVPEYGHLGGHLLAYTPASDEMKDFGEVVPKQSIICLASLHGKIYGGTSITGGLGIDASAKEAMLFEWDPVKEQKVFAMAPVPGATSLTALAVGPDEKIWGIADGTLFVFDPVSQKVVATRKLLHVNYGPRGTWRDGYLVLHPSGFMYATLSNKFMRIDPATLKVSVLRDATSALLAMDRKGHLYFHDGANLWEYIP
jgi:hypothetical protein